MSASAQLQFKLLPPEARRAALQRLALSGGSSSTISAQTGLSENEIRRQLEVDYHLLPGAGRPETWMNSRLRRRLT